MEWRVAGHVGRREEWGRRVARDPGSRGGLGSEGEMVGRDLERAGDSKRPRSVPTCFLDALRGPRDASVFRSLLVGQAPREVRPACAGSCLPELDSPAGLPARHTTKALRVCVKNTLMEK